MNKLKIWLFSGLIVIPALGGLVYLRGQVPEADSPADTSTQQEQETKGFAKPEVPSIQEKTKIDTEASVKALESGTLTDCDKITWSEILKKQCQNNLNFASVLKSGDETACEKISDENLKNQCYNRIYFSSAVDGKNPALCDKISDPALQQLCLDQLQMMLGRYASSAEECAIIRSEAIRSQCKDNYFLQASTKNLQVEGCSQISDNRLSDQCEKTVAKNVEVIQQSKKAAELAKTPRTLQDTLSLCDKLVASKSVTCKDAVYPQLAFEKKDLSHCSKISEPLKVTECQKEQGGRINEYFMRQSLALNDKTLCNLISDIQLKELCQNS